MAQVHSITELFSRLSEHYRPETRRVQFSLDPVDNRKVRKQFQSKVYTTLFSFLKNREGNDETPGCEKSLLDVKTRVWWYILMLRKKRRFDEANHLEQLFNSLTELIKDAACQEDVFSVLQFILKLKDTGTSGSTTGSSSREVLGHTDHKLPHVPNRCEELGLLPEGPLCYGDTQLIQPSRLHYMHYPRSVFEAEALEINMSNNNVCDMSPGTGLSGNGFFNVGGYLGDLHEKTTTETLFGGLVQGRVMSLDVRLDLPDLPEDTETGLLETRIPKSFSLHSMDNDEGFKSQEESVASTTPDDDLPGDASFDSGFHADYDTSIYEECLTMKLSQHYTWETIGLGPGPRMKPYLSEAGPEAFDQWSRAMAVSLKTAFPMVTVATKVNVAQGSLVKDVLNVMIAVPSMNFMLDLTDQCFTVREGVYVSGMSSEALQGLLEDFLDCGMFYYRLDAFSAPPTLNSFYTAGLTFNAFTAAIQMVLQYYRAAVLSIPPSQTLLQLRVTCHRLMQEMRFLAKLCRCDNPVTEETKGQFPMGVSLLTYIYQETMEGSFTDHYPLLLSLLKHTCTPFLRYIQDWVYHGVFRDTYGEFMIQVNDDYLQFKDKHYWTQGYVLTNLGGEESVPLFLRDMINDIFICGKSINLLKACNRDHFLLDVNDNEIPRITLTFSETELRALSNQCAVYSSRMQQIARQHSISREERLQAAQKAKHDLLAKARESIARDMQVYQDKMATLRTASRAKKRKELLFLKQQMEQDIRRRAGDKEAELQAGKDYIDSVLNKEGEELELERQAREEVIAYYSRLSEDAARREQKALWRVRRAKLGIARAEFLTQERARWAADMETAHDDLASVQITTPFVATPVPSEPELPRWARRDSDAPTLEVTDDVDSNTAPAELEGSPDKNLPKWALKGLQKYGMSAGKRSPSPLKSPSEKLVPAAGRKTPTRRSLNTSFSLAETDAEEAAYKPSIQTFEHAHATAESQTTDDGHPVKSLIKLVGDHRATEETQPEESRPHIKRVGEKHVSQAGEPEPESKPHIRAFKNVHANKETEEPEHDSVPRLKPGAQHAGSETSETEWKIKERSQFGHASETTSQQIVAFPKLKKFEGKSATQESVFSRDFGIKPRIRINKQMANTESSEPVEVRPGIKMSDRMHSSKESEYVDHDQNRLKMFKERNVYGHAADSTVQRLLYQGQFGAKSQDEGNQPVSDFKIIPASDQLMWLDMKVEPYMDNFDFLNDAPVVNLLSSLPEVQFGNYGNYGSMYKDIDGYQYLPLPAVVKASITGPLRSQISLVNESIVTYFMNELQIEDHFRALRRYLCMADGDFSEILCDLLMDKLATNPRPQEIVNPMFLNNCLNRAVRLSINVDDKLADNLSFLHKFVPKAMEQTAPDVFDCIELHFEVKWPLNIVITKNSAHKYGQVFSIMLKSKRVVWIIKDVWKRLKRDAIVHGVSGASQFRQLHLFRQEMHHFVKVMQDYTCHQIVDVTWREFQTDLRKHVHSLDDLHAAHNRYLDNALFRCLLTKNAASLMKIIQDIFHLILKFHRQLTSGSWRTAGTPGSSRGREPTHDKFTQMCNTYKIFREHSRFLFKVVSKLAVRGYEPHLHDLLLRLNFNCYYDH